MSVGYEYESCLDVILWEKRTAILQGYELDASNMGGWMLDKHHVLDIQNGKTSFFSWICYACVCVVLGYGQVISTLKCSIICSDQDEIWFIISFTENRGEF